ncbi:MAG: SGNH/GDSL hydrolase family protein [Acetatifactor sp.]
MKKISRKQIIVLAGTLFLTGVMLCGCGKATVKESEDTRISTELQTSESPEEQQKEEQQEGLVRTTFLSEEDMALADMWPSCDDGALADLMRRAETEEQITVVCIGGSITQGVISQGPLDSTLESRAPYADIFRDWWKERFPNTEVKFINAGIGGTDSYLGVHRLERDVLSYEPDLVLVEFSVNDGNDSFYKKSYDNLIYQLLSAPKRPAVMLLFMAQTNGTSAQANHAMVGFHYQLPMVSYANVLKSFLEEGRYSEKELAGDGVHPSALGHAITGEILWTYLNQVYAEREKIPWNESEPEALTKAVYGNARVLDSTDIEPLELGDFREEHACPQFNNGWVCDGENGIEFTATFSRLGLLYYATADGKSGQYEVFVDGVSLRKIDADFSGGWGNAIKAVEVFRENEPAEHTVLIRRADDSQGEVFHLLGLLTSE